jgi:hypothetical protein
MTRKQSGKRDGSVTRGKKSVRRLKGEKEFQESGKSNRTRTDRVQSAGAPAKADVSRAGAAEKNNRRKKVERPAHFSTGVAMRPIRRHRRKRVRLGEAFRKVGLDEQTVAETYVGVVETLRNNSTEDPVQKLLVDVLKECSRVLEPPRGASTGPSDQPSVVQLYHQVPRPERELLAGPEGAEAL